MGLISVERRLERMVEGLFGRMFKSGVRPVELGRRLVRSMEDGRSVGVTGETVVPNHFTIALSPSDHAEYADIEDTLKAELAEAAREHAREESYGFMGPLAVDFVVDDELYTGTFAIDGRLRQATGGGGAGSLVLPSGERVVLGEYIVSFGRLPECTITLADTNVSRNHAEIRPHGTDYQLRDLGSTNGTKVNGHRVVEHVLRDGDDIDFGTTRIRFEAS